MITPSFPHFPFISKHPPPIHQTLTIPPSQPSTVDAPGYTPVEGETIPRRNYRYPNHLVTYPEPDPSIKTIYDVVQFGIRTYGNAKCVGYRDLLKVHRETKKVPKKIDGKEEMVDKEWTYFELGPYKWLTYIQFEKLLLAVGSGLRELGLEKGDKVHLYASTG